VFIGKTKQDSQLITLVSYTDNAQKFVEQTTDLYLSQLKEYLQTTSLTESQT
jgi:hypothetical protein